VQCLHAELELEGETGCNVCTRNSSSKVRRGAQRGIDFDQHTGNGIDREGPRSTVDCAEVDRVEVNCVVVEPCADQLDADLTLA
jgi:hypothetical protein